MTRKPASRSTASRAWQRMLSGRRLDLLDPSPLDVEIADIAHGLARVARWNGQTEGAHIFSVAQHTLLVDVVALLVRSEYYADDDDDKAEKAGEAELIIAKQRNGPTGEIKLTFLKEFTRFEDRASDTA